MQRRATKTTRGPNSAEKHFVGWVKNRDQCSACGNHRPVIAHHAMGATYKHRKTLIGHFFVLGLCEECDGVVTHGNRRWFKQCFGLQSKLWEPLAEEYERETGRLIPEEIKLAIGTCNE